MTPVVRYVAGAGPHQRICRMIGELPSALSMHMTARPYKCGSAMRM